MSDANTPLAGAGGPQRQQEEVAPARRVGAWLVWWTLMMSFWVLVDNSIQTAELLAGAGVAAIAAFVAEVVQHQSASRFRMRIEWVVPALSLPRQVLTDTAVVFGALWDQVVHGRAPNSGFRAMPVSYGDDTVEGSTRRVLIVGGNSVAPNTFVLGLDRDEDVMIVHQLVVEGGDPVG